MFLASGADVGAANPRKKDKGHISRASLILRETSHQYVPRKDPMWKEDMCGRNDVRGRRR